MLCGTLVMLSVVLHGKVDSQCHGLCPFDAFGMVVCRQGSLLRSLQYLFLSFEPVPHGTDTHGRSIPERAVWLRGLAMYPLGETTSVAPFRVRIPVAPVVQGFPEVSPFYQGIGHCNGTDGIIGKFVLRGKPLKVVVVRRFELPPASHDVSYNCS